MPRKDRFHDAVVRALRADGWVITHDPLFLSYRGRDTYVDLGAEQPIAAEKGGRKIAVEIKSFLSASDLYDFEVALGQYTLYRGVLAEAEPERTLYLAIPIRAHLGIFSEPLGQLLVAREQMKLLVFDEVEEKVVQWIP